MNPEEYPVEPPEGIFHFPQDVFCLIKKEDTGKESIAITRISGSEFDFKVTAIDLTEEEKTNFSVKLFRKIEEEEEQEPKWKEMISQIPESGDRRENVFDRRAGVPVSEAQEQRTGEQDRRFGEIDKPVINLDNENKFQVRVTEGTKVKFGHTISYSAGSNLITLDDSTGAGDNWSNAYDMDDVLSACSSVVTKQGANAFDISARLYFLSGVYFISEREFVELTPNPINPSYAIDGDAGSHIRFGNYNTTDEYSYAGAYWDIYLNSTGTRTNRFDGEILIYGSNIWTNGTTYQKTLNFWGTTRIFNSVITGPAYISGADTNFQDIKWHSCGGMHDMLFATGYDYDFSGITAINCQYGIFFSSTTNAPVDIYNVIFQSCTYDIGLISTSHLIRVINSPFETYYPLSSGRSFKECYTFNIRVADDEGDPIIGATVTLTDVDGTEVFSEDTITGGVLAADELVVRKWFRNAAQGGNKDYNLHTLRITKDNYLDHECTIIIDHKIEDDLITLYEPEVVLKIWNGSQWVPQPLKVWDGNDWLIS